MISGANYVAIQSPNSERKGKSKSEHDKGVILGSHIGLYGFCI